MKRVMTWAIIVAVVSFLITGLAWAKSDLEILKETNRCPNCMLSGARLDGAILIRADLSGANLQGAKLDGADLRRAYLQGAILILANLRRAKLRGTYLEGADLTGATWPDGSTCKAGSVGRCNK